MSCCGQHRNVLPVQVTGATVPAGMANSPGANQQGAAFGSSIGPERGIAAALPAGGSVTLRYREHTRVQVRGPVTGRNYAFAPPQPTLVDARDAEALLRSQRFVRAVAQSR